MNQYTDHTGVVRNLGSLPIPEGFVSSFKPYEDSPEMPMFSDEEIIRIVSDPGRRKIAEVLPFEQYGTDQHSTNACNGHAAAGAFTNIHKLQGLDEKFVGSGSYVYSKINNGRDQGSNLEDGMNQLINGGVCSQETVPYNLIYPRMYSKDADTEAAYHKAEVIYRAKTLQGFKSGLAAGYQGVNVVTAGAAFDRLTDGICGVIDSRGNHATLSEDIEWDGHKFVYPSRNSWGIRWGNKGRMKLVDAHFRSSFNFHVFYIIASVKVTPRQEN